MAKRYRSAEVCRLLDLQPYVLRYWATEFPTLGSPPEGSGAQATYGEEELAQLRRIKRLLYEEGYTIAGARKKLESEPITSEERSAAAAPLFDESEPAAPVATKKKSKAARADADASSDATESDALDTRDDQRIESLRRGVAEALSEARDILTRLGRAR